MILLKHFGYTDKPFRFNGVDNPSLAARCLKPACILLFTSAFCFNPITSAEIARLVPESRDSQSLLRKKEWRTTSSADALLVLLRCSRQLVKENPVALKNRQAPAVRRQCVGLRHRQRIGNSHRSDSRTTCNAINTNPKVL